MGARVPVIFLLLLSLVWTSGNASSESNNRVTCYDSTGERVDWWIVYKNAGDGTFVELTSRDVANPNMTRAYGTGLKAGRSLYGSEFSPIIKTINMNISEEYVLTSTGAEEQDSAEEETKEDNRLFFAWNDEMPRGEIAKDEHEEDITTGEESVSEESEDISPVRGRSKEAGCSKSKTPPAFRGTSKERRSPSKESSTKKHGEEPTAAERRAAARKAATAKNMRTGQHRDMYGNTLDMRVAHSKGMFGMGFDKKSSTVSFYVITHSIPGIPGFDTWYPSNPIKRIQPPEYLETMFEDSALMGNTKAQHAMCLSMEQSVRVKGGIIQFDRAHIDHDRDNLFAFLDGLDIIHPGMVMADYDPWARRHRAYHQLFNVAEKWTGKRWDDSIVHDNANAPRKSRDSVLPSKHAFVLWPTAVARRGRPKKVVAEDETRFVSRRQPLAFNRNRCALWDASHLSKALQTSALFTGRKLPDGHQCFLSVTLRTTAVDGDAMELTVDFKHGLVPADLDDIIKRHLVVAKDLDAAKAPRPVAPSAQTTHVSYAVIVQSWIDRGTQGPRKYILSRGGGNSVTAWFLNSTHVRLPVEDTRTRHMIVPSSGRDHAKWFVSYAYGASGQHLAIAGVSDINRNNKATRLSKADYGRSGAVFVTSNPDVVSFFYDIAGGVEDTARFASLDLGSAVANTTDRLATVKYVNSTMVKVFFATKLNFKTRIPFFNLMETLPAVSAESEIESSVSTTLTVAKPHAAPGASAIKPVLKPSSAAVKPIGKQSLASVSKPTVTTVTKAVDKTALAKAISVSSAISAKPKVAPPKITLKVKNPVSDREGHSDEYYSRIINAAVERVKDTPLPKEDDFETTHTTKRIEMKPHVNVLPMRVVKQPVGAFTYRETRDGPVEVALDAEHTEL